MHDDHTSAAVMAWLLKGTDKVIVNSHYARTSVLRKTKLESDEVVIIPSGIDSDMAENIDNMDLQTEFSVKNECVIIGIFGRIVDWKGHEIFLDVASRIISQDHDCHFLIVGKGEQEYEHRLREYARS